MFVFRALQRLQSVREKTLHQEFRVVVATNRRVVLGEDDSADARAAFDGLEGLDRAYNWEIAALVRIRNRGVAVLTAGRRTAVLQNRRADTWAGEGRAPPPGARSRTDERWAVVVRVNTIRQGRVEDRGCGTTCALGLDAVSDSGAGEALPVFQKVVQFRRELTACSVRLVAPLLTKPVRYDARGPVLGGAVGEHGLPNERSGSAAGLAVDGVVLEMVEVHRLPFADVWGSGCGLQSRALREVQEPDGNSQSGGRSGSDGEGDGDEREMHDCDV